MTETQVEWCTCRHLRAGHVAEAFWCRYIGCECAVFKLGKRPKKRPIPSQRSGAEGSEG